MDESLLTGESVLTAAQSDQGGGGGGTVDSVSAGPGISVTGTATDPIVNNTGAISVSSPDSVVAVAPTTGNVVVTQNVVATWGSPASVRFFAVDTAAGNDANAGFSDASQAAAGLVALKTIAKLLQILPKLGNGRSARVAIKAGNYASDATVPLTGYTGYKALLVIGTDTVASASSVAFAGDANDTLCAGMTTATGMNAAGYNPTAYSSTGADGGTPTITLQVAGGGAPGFAAPPARPFGARLRFDSATTTVALRNYATTVLQVVGTTQLILALGLPTAPAVGDVCYLEMPNVTGPTTTDLSNSSLYLAGLNLGSLRSSNFMASEVVFCGCDAGSLSWIGGALVASPQQTGIAPTARTGYSLHSTGGIVQGAAIASAIGGGWTDTGASLNGAVIIFEPTSIDLEAFSMKSLVVLGGTHAVGTIAAEVIGTGSSTAHGATAQIWGTSNLFTGVAAGLQVQGGYLISRVKCSNAGANPAMRLNGCGLGAVISGPSGAAADGNADVGMDLTPLGLGAPGTGAIGCSIAVFNFSSALPTITGTLGDVRLPGGAIVSWAQLLATGMTDLAGNRIISLGTGGTGSSPLTTVKSFSGVLQTSNSAPSSGFATDVGIVAVAITGNESGPMRYPTSMRWITRLRLSAPLGSGAQPLTATLYKNGSATAMTCTLTASSPASITAVDAAHPILFADGDQFDVLISCATTAEGNQPFSATLEGP
jgi:hypothetical protein